MVTHYFTLLALTRELNAILHSAAIREIFTQQKNELIISAGPARTGTLPEDAYAIHCSVDPKLNYLFVEEGGSRAKRNSTDLFGEVSGSTIQSFAIQPFERTLKMSLQDGRLLFFQLYGSASSNVFLTDEHQTILNAFKNRNRFEGTPFRVGERLFNAGILGDPVLFRQALRNAAQTTAYPALKAAAPVLGSTFTREALHRANVDEQTPASELDDAAVDRVFDEVRTIVGTAGDGEAFIYYRGMKPAVLSVIPLRHLAGAQAEQFDSINRAIRTFIGKAFRSRTFESEKNGMLASIGKQLDRARRLQAAARARASGASRADEFERLGRLIMGNLYRIESGSGRIELPDSRVDGETVTVTLNPALTPARNAETFFERAKKARLDLREADARSGALDRKVAVLEKMLLHLDNCHSREQLSEFKKEYGPALKGTEPRRDAGGEERLPYRTFEVTGGFQVLVGKSSTDNDLLTMRYAKPNDLWFHVRGAGGSHTVLQVGKGQQVPREAIREAAGIAAYYSKMRKAGNVPVAYCERKYVRKRKGAPPGTVTLEREQTLFVKPRLP